MKVVRAILVIVALSTSVIQGNPTGRIIDGIPVDTFKRFPHHVTIHIFSNDKEIRNCSGSIIAEQWILTSIGCVAGGDLYRLDFNRKYIDNPQSTFSVVVFKNSVISYPTGYDDIALIKIPVRLEYSQYVKSISLYQHRVDNEFVVMPGFGNATNQLTYGMFQIVSNMQCANEYGDKFDKYLQMCVRGWNNNRNAPCEGNQGGGLIKGWPREPQLVGVFSTPVNCRPGAPAIYMDISHYITWIESITGKLSPEDIPSTTTAPITTTTPPPAEANP